MQEPSLNKGSCFSPSYRLHLNSPIRHKRSTRIV
ncbi:hypothetical protein EV691_101218 [Azotobacter chroococcum]|jgi:hypothetical protein|uniref:Uncharacterized protein n=1 Tax=Azotobacter chroococcum TaxID=353 RepID=A0A4R1PUB6_9GAMM|nr:hypothetical protein EV691_101218 [Azotobacter chroococcum]